MARIIPCEICGHAKTRHDSVMCRDCPMYGFSGSVYKDENFMHKYKMNNLIYLENKSIEKKKRA